MAVFTLKVIFSKWPKNMGNFCKKICHHTLSKIAQYGHTDGRPSFIGFF